MAKTPHKSRSWPTKMWVRIRFDIGWRDLFLGLRDCLWSWQRKSTLCKTEQAWGDEPDFLVTLSVRSSFDLALRALQLPRGSEVLFSAITVPDMIRIAESHGLVIVPVDTDDRGQLCLSSLKKSLTPNTKMLVVAHLFGCSAPMEEVCRIVDPYDLLIVEDCAQSFRNPGGRGHPRSDFVMHSFGPIKTCTALGGSVVKIPSQRLRSRMLRLLESDPVQSRASFARRVVRFGVLKALSGCRTSGLLKYVVTRFGHEFDSFANSLGRSFSGVVLQQQIRKQPSEPLLRLLRRRWMGYDSARFERRIEMGRRLDTRLEIPPVENHLYWVYPLFVDEAERLASELNRIGFDATCRSRMRVVEGDQNRTRAVNAKSIWRRVVFLPWYPDLPNHELDRMADCVRAFQSRLAQ